MTGELPCANTVFHSYNHDYLEALEQNIFIPIENTHYLLVEFDVRKELGNENEVEDRLYEIQYKGYTPVIAHVERYFKDSLDIERIQDFIDNGYLIQVNATSFWDIMVNMLKSLLINY